MAKTITEYNALISCPSDVNEELNIINNTINDFNRLFGRVNNLRIQTIHWSIDSYPESGGQPQKLLNRQIVDDCDIAIAVFWTRFGSPTDEYESGTEEEIERFIESGKQVFLYFCNRPVNPKTFNADQYQNVQDFKKKYEGRGIYSEYSETEEFEQQILNHLTSYFIKRIQGKSNVNVASKLFLELIKYNNNTYFKYQLKNADYLKKLKENAIDLMEKISSLDLQKESKPNNESNVHLAKLPSLSLFSSTPVKFNAEDINLINEFAKKNEMKISDDFFYLGSLVKNNNPLIHPFGGYSLEGEDIEREKYDLILDLLDKVITYENFNNYYTSIDNLYFVNLALCNNGKSFDEDIDITLFIPKGFIVVEPPKPNDYILDKVTQVFEFIFKPQKTVNIDEYPDYPKINTFKSVYPYKDEIEDNKNVYISLRDKIFNYTYLKEDDFDIIRYHQNYIKHNTKTHTPSYLIFKQMPEEIGYEIKSKYAPEVFNGVIKFC